MVHVAKAAAIATAKAVSTVTTRCSELTLVETNTAPLSQILPEKNEEIVAKLRSILNTVHKLLSSLQTPTVRTVFKVMEILNPVFSYL